MSGGRTAARCLEPLLSGALAKDAKRINAALLRLDAAGLIEASTVKINRKPREVWTVRHCANAPIPASAHIGALGHLALRQCANAALGVLGDIGAHSLAQSTESGAA